eukprot:CAMPEP_0197191148 /NCGR_PEP_ID=MMETSP1423-20130617/22859_1 /TAXON_ID=476441 /ORGANISM="Pseudo-nitzschia heimii, Strain UNC1101" /LENGTH=337 /DNA_ID=CAMNT_0042643703 /DNA_START=38 /DNA_END=1051 /DNA_ORIENTATION=-
MAKAGQQSERESVSPSLSSSRFVYFLVVAVVVPFVAAIGQMVMGSNRHLSSEQRNQDITFLVAVGVSAAVGLAAFLYFDKKRNLKSNDKNDKSSASSKSATSKGSSIRPKDIWKVGESKHDGLKKPKAAYEEKPFGSKYYYAHNDSNTTGGYKDGLKMEDYRMNGPRLLSVNGKFVDVGAEKDSDNHGKVSEGVSNFSTTNDNTDSVPTRITALDPNAKNITKYLWDDPNNGKGIATIRVDVLPGEKFGEFVKFSDVKIKDVSATLPGEGLMAKIVVSDNETTSYQLKINKLYGDAADVKVIIKPKRLLIKVYKKKQGFLSGNSDNLKPWPQPHRKI